jgi:hypothetical protein
MARPKPDDPVLRGLLGELERTPIEHVRLLAVRPLDSAAHDRARTEAEKAARSSGRITRHAAAMAWVDDLLLTMFTRHGLPLEAAFGVPHEALGAQDRVHVRHTLDDAILAVLVCDLVDEATYDELLGPCAGLVEDAGI